MWRAGGMLGMLLALAACSPPGDGGGQEDMSSPPEATPDLARRFPDFAGVVSADLGCQPMGAYATVAVDPIDLILVIDDSASMSDAIQDLERYINEHFTSWLGRA